MVNHLSVVGYSTVAFSFGLFYIFDIILEHLGLPKLVVDCAQSTLASTKEKDDLTYTSWKWRNRLLSITHSFITGSWSLACFYLDPELAEDLIVRNSAFSVALVAFSIGYFFHDIYHLTGEHSRQAMELVLHHAVVIFCFGISVVSLNFVGYAVVALVVEVNSLFLHVRQVIKMLGFGRPDTLYRLVSLVNIGTFIIFRITTLTWMTRWLVINRDRIRLDFFTAGSVGMAIITAINIVLLYRLLASDFLTKSKRELKKSN